MVLLAAAGETIWLYSAGFPSGGAGSVFRTVTAGLVSYGLIGFAVLIHITAGATVITILRGLHEGTCESSPDPAAWLSSSFAVSCSVYVLGDYLNDNLLGGVAPTHFLSLFLVAVSVTVWVLSIGPVAILFDRAGQRWLTRSESTVFNLSKRNAHLAVFPVTVLAAALIIGSITADVEIPWNEFTGETAHQDQSASRIQLPESTGKPARIVLISVETLRADHLNCLGYDRGNTTPELCRIASDGYLFSGCRAQAPWTKPSVASIITSLYPCRHGQIEYGTEVADSLVTLPDALAAAGYITAAFPTLNGAFDRNFGFHENYYRGFGPPESSWPSFFQLDLFAGGRLVAGFLERRLRIYIPGKLFWWYNDAEKVKSAVKRWLDSPEPRLFCHVHFIDPHTPYLTHPYKPVEWNFRSETNLPAILDKYDGEIRFVDRAIGEIANLLEQRKEPAVLVIVGDHGEEFLDRGGWGHGHSLYDELIRVPLIFKLYRLGIEDLVREGSVFADPVSCIDIAPTILELAGVEEPPIDWDGLSLVPQISSGSSRRGGAHAVSHMKSRGRTAHSIVCGEIKVIKFSDFDKNGETRIEAYDLSVDEVERSNIFDSRLIPGSELSTRVAAVITTLDSLLVSFGSPGKSVHPANISRSEAEILKTLGYLQ